MILIFFTIDKEKCRQTKRLLLHYLEKLQIGLLQ